MRWAIFMGNSFLPGRQRILRIRGRPGKKRGEIKFACSAFFRFVSPFRRITRKLNNLPLLGKIKKEFRNACWGFLLCVLCFSLRVRCNFERRGAILRCQLPKLHLPSCGQISQTFSQLRRRRRSAQTQRRWRTSYPMQLILLNCRGCPSYGNSSE